VTKGGYDVTELIDADYTLPEIIDAGFTPTDLKGGEFSATVLKNNGLTLPQLRTAFTDEELDGVFTDDQIRAYNLKQSGSTVADLIDEFSVFDLKVAGFTLSELKVAVNLNDLKNDFTLTQLKTEFSLTQLKTANFSNVDL
jgi:hypothetical protein